MTALTPSLALGYLRELSADIRDGIVVDGKRRRLAGEPRLLGPALALLTAVGDSARAEGRVRGGAVFAARAGGLAIVLACGPQALPAVVHHDLALVLGDLGAPGLPKGTPAEVPAPLAERLLFAAQRGPGD